MKQQWRVMSPDWFRAISWFGHEVRLPFDLSNDPAAPAGNTEK
jgi:hypothetical protein